MSKLLYLLYTCKMDSRSTTKILSSPCDLYTTFKVIWSHSVTLWNKPIWKSSPLSWLSNHICNYLNKIWEVKWKGWFLLFSILRLGVLAGSTVCLFSSRNLLPSEPFSCEGTHTDICSKHLLRCGHGCQTDNDRGQSVSDNCLLSSQISGFWFIVKIFTLFGLRWM